MSRAAAGAEKIKTQGKGREERCSHTAIRVSLETNQKYPYKDTYKDVPK